MFLFPYLANKVRVGVCCLFSSLFAQLIHMTAAAASAATAASLLMGAAGVQEHHLSAAVQQRFDVLAGTTTVDL